MALTETRQLIQYKLLSEGYQQTASNGITHFIMNELRLIIIMCIEMDVK